MKTKMSRSNSLRTFIKAEFGNQSTFANFLDVTPQSVGHWVQNNPRMLFKYLPEIKGVTGKSYDYLVNVVLNAEEEILKN